MGYSSAFSALLQSARYTDPQQFIVSTLKTDLNGSVPSTIDVTLTWNGTAQSQLIYNTSSSDVAGETYYLPAEVSSPVTVTGRYLYNVDIRATLSGRGPIVRDISDYANVVGTDVTTQNGKGWSLDGVDSLVSVTGGELRVYGSGGSRFFSYNGDGTYTSPLNDFGALAQSGSGFVYTAKDQEKWYFSSAGLMTGVVDPHGLWATFAYNAHNALTTVTFPDGAVTTLGYDGSNHLASITEPGNHVVTLTVDGSDHLTQITNPDGALLTFSYDSSDRLTNTQWGPLNAATSAPLNLTVNYDSTTGLPATVTWSGSSWAIKPAEAAGLGTTSGVTVIQANQGLGTIKDPNSHTTTYMLDTLGRLTQLTTPDGVTQSWARDTHGQVTTYTDGLNNNTIYTYDYSGSGKGDLTEIQNPPDSNTNVGNEQFSYDSTFHHLTVFQDELSNKTTLTYDNTTGDLLTIQDASSNRMTFTWAGGLLSTITDPVNTTTHTALYYDTHNRLSMVVDTLGDRSMFTHDAAGNVTIQIDGNGVQTNFQFDGMDRVTSVSDPVTSQRLYAYHYNALGAITSETDELTHTTSSVYEAHGWLQSVTEAVGTAVQRTESYLYDSAGNVTQTTDVRGNWQRYSYDVDDRVTMVTDSLGGWLGKLYYNANGNVTEIVDPNNHVSTFVFDNLNREINSTDGNGKHTATSYNLAGFVTEVDDAAGNATTQAYDALNRVISVTRAAGTSLAQTTALAYDALGNLTEVTDAKGNTVTSAYDALNRVVNSTDGVNNHTAYQYDKVGNLIQVTDPLNTTTTIAYDALNRVTSTTRSGSGLTQTTLTAYDAASNVVSVTDPLGNTTTYVVDALNRTTVTIDALNYRTTLVLDAANNVLQLKDAKGHLTQFTYDARNRVTQATDPLSNFSTYTYYADGELSAVKDRNGRETNFSYDGDNRLTGEIWHDAGGTQVGSLTYVYDALGNLITATISATQTLMGSTFTYSAKYTMTYDALNRASTVQEPFGLSLNFYYDAVGNRTEVDDSLNGVTKSVYDNANRLTSRTFGGTGQTPLRVDLAYNAAGQVKTETRYSDLAGSNVVGTTSFLFDSLERVTGLQQWNAGHTAMLDNTTYAYDSGNRVTSMKDNGTTTNYSYNNVNELTSDGVNNLTAGATIGYDGVGNITNTGFTSNSDNALTNNGVYTFSYDAEGNLTKKEKSPSGTTWEYSYNNRNQLVQAQEWTADPSVYPTTASLLMEADYEYDALGNRIAKIVTNVGPNATATTAFGYDGWDPAKGAAVGTENFDVWADVNVTGSGQTLQTRYLRGDAVDQVFAQVDGSGNASWLLTDRLGSVHLVTNGSGTVTDTINYDAWGNTTDTSALRYRWNGREYDSETGLFYNRGRYYDPTIGRWISQDPLGFSAGDSNLYRYVNNQPTEATDPSGEQYGIQGPPLTTTPLPNGSQLVYGDNITGQKDGGRPSRPSVYVSYEGKDAGDVLWIQFFKVTWQPAVIKTRPQGKYISLVQNTKLTPIALTGPRQVQPSDPAIGSWYYIDAYDNDNRCYASSPYYNAPGSKLTGGVVPGTKSFILDAPNSARYVYFNAINQDPTWVGGIATITFYDYAVSTKTHQVLGAITWTETYGDLEPASVSGITGWNNSLFSGNSVISRPTQTDVDPNALALLNNAVHIYFGDQFGTIRR